MRTIVIGTSAIARNHLDALKWVGIECVGISGRSNLANLERLAVEFNIPKTFTSWEKALSESEFDSLVICTPPEVSFEILNHISGSHLACLVEKPALQTEIQLSQLVGLSLKRTFVAFNRRHYETVTALKDHISRESSGELVVEIHEPHAEGKVARVSSIINNSIHILDLILYLTRSKFTDIQIENFSTSNLGFQVYMIANRVPVSLAIRFGIPANTFLSYDTLGTRYQLKPIEQLTRYNNFSISEPTSKSSIRIYQPSWTSSESQITYEPTAGLKPGFLNQVTEFKNFADKGVAAPSMTSIYEASQALQLAFHLSHLL
jgi:hypothetical protein